MSDSTPVVVVGAGPVGLVLACELARRAVAVRIFDKLPAPTAESRAAVAHARTLEAFSRIGVVETIAAGQRTAGLQMYALFTQDAGPLRVFPMLGRRGRLIGQLDDDGERQIAETRNYLDDADEFLQTETTAVDPSTPRSPDYPNHLGRTVLWAGTRGMYDVRENPDGDVAQILLRSWL